MEQTIRVNKAKLINFQKSYRKLKLKNFFLSLTIFFLLFVAGTQQFIIAQPKTQPIIMGTGTMEKIGDNTYQIFDDDKEYLLEEYKLPPMPEITKQK